MLVYYIVKSNDVYMKVCLIQVLDYEAQKDFKKKRVLECEKCPLRFKCGKKEKKEGEIE